MDYKAVVRDGYDQIANLFSETVKNHKSYNDKVHYSNVIEKHLSGKSSVLDIGCGSGIPVCSSLATAGHSVLGIDISSGQIELAKKSVPSARFKCSDILECDFEDNRFHAISAFFSLFHMPREKLPCVLQKVACWLRPSGIFVFSIAVNEDNEYFEQPDFLGVKMYFSWWDAETTECIVRSTGLSVKATEIRSLDQNIIKKQESLRVLWIIAEKSSKCSKISPYLPLPCDFEDLKIEAENDSEIPLIHSIHVDAFGQEDEARLVDDLRKGDTFVKELSLVLKKKDNIIGHVLLSRIYINNESDSINALGLAPVGILHEYQKKRYGSFLISEALNRARSLGHKICVVLGAPKLYHRFGFFTASFYNIRSPEKSWPLEAFQVLALEPGALDGVHGTVKYPPAFGIDELTHLS